MDTPTFGIHVQDTRLRTDAASTYLARATWVLVAALATMAVSVWVLQVDRTQGGRWFQHSTEARTVIGLALLVSFVVLLVMLALMVRKLGQQIRDSAAQQRLIEAQNDGLRARRDALESTVHRFNESERRLAEAQRIAQIGTWEVDPQTREVFWSDEMYRLLDIAPSDFTPSYDTFLARVHEDDRALVRDKMGRAMRGESAFEEEIRVNRPGGSVRKLLTRGALVTWDGADRRKVVGTAQDITERKRAETALHDAEARLRQSQKMEAVGQLAGGIAHDFNNLLTVILSYSMLLLMSDGDLKENAEPLNEIKGAAERAAALTHQLLAFSRQQILQPRVLDLNGTVKEVDKLLRRLIGENIEVRTVLPAQIGLVKADPGQIEQVLINLAVNARDAMRDGGTLTIETADVELDGSYVYRGATAKPGPYVMLAVTDSGSGIRPEIRERIFEPFYTTKVQGQGTGLGLSTVHGIVEQSGGHVWVYSELGIGTTFKIYLPRADTERADPPRRISAPVTQQGTETILLVEDEPSVRSVARRVLTRAGYTVIEASNGAEALHICDDEDCHIDLIISDMVMPGMSGGQLMQELKARRPETRSLVMSGYTRDVVVRADVLRAESSFIEKPFTPDSLLRTVRALLDRVEEHPFASA